MPRPAKRIDPSTFAGGVASILRARRTRKKLTVDQAAELAGVPAKTWYHWESAHHLPPMDRLPAIAAALGCKPRDLMPS